MKKKWLTFWRILINSKWTLSIFLLSYTIAKTRLQILEICQEALWTDEHRSERTLRYLCLKQFYYCRVVINRNHEKKPICAWYIVLTDALLLLFWYFICDNSLHNEKFEKLSIRHFKYCVILQFEMQRCSQSHDLFNC